MKKEHIIIFALIILIFAISSYFYPAFPEKIASHWNAKGNADSYSSKGTIFLIPIIALALIVLFLIIPKIDPLKQNIKKFEKYYLWFIVVFILFMFLIQLQIILWNLSIGISPNIIFPIGIAILFFYVSVLLKHTKRNWFIGIRTPWTLSNDKVWDKTHKLGSQLFLISGILSFIGIFFSQYAWLFIIIPVLAFTILLVVYSYLIYRKMK